MRNICPASASSSSALSGRLQSAGGGERSLAWARGGGALSPASTRNLMLRTTAPAAMLSFRIPRSFWMDLCLVSFSFSHSGSDDSTDDFSGSPSSVLSPGSSDFSAAISSFSARLEPGGGGGVRGRQVRSTQCVWARRSTLAGAGAGGGLQAGAERSSVLWAASAAATPSSEAIFCSEVISWDSTPSEDWDRSKSDFRSTSEGL